MICWYVCGSAEPPLCRRVLSDLDWEFGAVELPDVAAADIAAPAGYLVVERTRTPLSGFECRHLNVTLREAGFGPTWPLSVDGRRHAVRTGNNATQTATQSAEFWVFSEFACLGSLAFIVT